MPENETDNQEQNVDVKDGEKQDGEQQDAKRTSSADETKETNETKTDIVDEIKNIIKGNADNDADNKDDGKGNDSEGDDIPDEFTEAALKEGWTKEEIEAWTSDLTDDELREYAKDLFLLSEIKEGSDKSEQSSKEGDTIKKDDKVKDGAKDEVIVKLTERLDKLEKGQEKNIERGAQEKRESQALRASQVMDELSKEFEIFGTFDKLLRFPDGRIVSNSPQVKARNEVWGLASDLHEKAGMDFEKALSTSLDAFKGKNLAKDVKRNLIKDLKKSEKRLSPKHSSHEQVKTGLSGAEVIREVQKKHGVDTS